MMKPLSWEGSIQGATAASAGMWRTAPQIRQTTW